MSRQDSFLYPLEGCAKNAKEEPGLDVDTLAHLVIGAAIEVHRHLGPGYLESVYEAAVATELDIQEISYQRQCAMSVNYKGRQVGQGKVDFLVSGKLVLELKAVDKLPPVHKAQVISYLKVSGCQLGLLINFNESTLREGIQRVVLTG
jgi:GxxExxY protein